MADDAFDTNALLDTQYTGDLNRNTVPVPAGEYYARIKENSVKVRKFTSKAGNEVCMCDMAWVIDDPDLAADMQVKEPTAFGSIFLQLSPGSNKIATKEEDPNANIQLGRLKYAMGIKEGKPWSVRAFEGMACYIRVESEPDPNDIENVRSKVTGFYKEQKKSK
jgi:hypothetical protein